MNTSRKSAMIGSLGAMVLASSLTACSSSSHAPTVTDSAGHTTTLSSRLGHGTAAPTKVSEKTYATSSKQGYILDNPAHDVFSLKKLRPSMANICALHMFTNSKDYVKTDTMNTMDHNDQTGQGAVSAAQKAILKNVAPKYIPKNMTPSIGKQNTKTVMPQPGKTLSCIASNIQIQDADANKSVTDTLVYSYNIQIDASSNPSYKPDNKNKTITDKILKKNGITYHIMIVNQSHYGSGATNSQKVFNEQADTIATTMVKLMMKHLSV